MTETLNTNLESRFPEMIEAQDALNRRTAGPDWAAKALPRHIAIVTEVAEAIESLPWKWWKGGEADLENLKVELIDLWHFVLSWAIQERLFEDGGYSHMHIINQANRIVETHFNTREIESGKIDQTALIRLLVQIMHHASSPDSEEPGCYDLVALVMSKILAAYLHVAPEDPLPARYLVKNWLNEFRQVEGYKETGSPYRKTLEHDGKAIEDNEFAYAFMLERPEASKGELFNALKQCGYGRSAGVDT